MKKILVTLSLIAFVAFTSNAQTSTTAASKEVKKETVKTETTATTTSATGKKACCHKGGTAANCTGKSAKNCAKAGADSKAQKATTTGSGSN